MCNVLYVLTRVFSEFAIIHAVFLDDAHGVVDREHVAVEAVGLLLQGRLHRKELIITIVSLIIIIIISSSIIIIEYIYIYIYVCVYIYIYIYT